MRKITTYKNYKLNSYKKKYFHKFLIDDVSKKWGFLFFIFLKRSLSNHISLHHVFVNQFVSSDIHIAQPLI